MKILSWNILHGGGDRRAAIGSVLACHNPDVIILSEVHSDTVVEVRPLLCMQAWEYCASTASDSAVNALCVLSRTPIVPRDSCPVPPENAVRWLDVDLPTHGFGFGALHIPTTLGRREVDGGSKRRFWAAVVNAAADTSSSCSLAISIPGFEVSTKRGPDLHLLRGVLNDGGNRLD